MADFEAIQDYLRTILGTSRSTPQMATSQTPAIDITDALTSTSNISATFESVARSMTNNIRQNGNTTLPNVTASAQNIVNGTSSDQDTFVTVNYSKRLICQPSSNSWSRTD